MDTNKNYGGTIKEENLLEIEEFIEFEPNSRDEFESDENIPENKCGEIFLQGNDTVLILCTYCSSFFTQFAEFMLHLKDNHSNVEQHKSNSIDSSTDNSIDLRMDQPTSKIEPTTEMFPFIDVQAVTSENYNNEKTSHSTDIDLKDKVLNKIKTSHEQISKLRNLREKLMQDLSKAIHSKMCKNTTNSQLTGKFCNKTFNTENTTKKYEPINYEISKTIADSSKDRYQNKSNDNIETRNLFSQTSGVYNDPKTKLCRFCGEEFQDSSKRTVHERLHTGERPFKCQICPKSFRSKGCLKTHINTHGAERPYKCKICNAAFKEKYNYNSHAIRHTGKKRFKCSYCDKSFYQRTERKTHERRHTGEKPFQCNECGKCFITSNRLNVHIKRHKYELGLVNKEHKCEICEKLFFGKHELEKHLTIHRNERPFECEICKKKFKLNKALAVHKKIHLDVPQYICKICGKGFKQSPGLYSHMKSHGKPLT